MKAPVSVIVLTLNEEQNIENCLKSVYGWSDDIYIVDSYSTDSTVEIAKRFTNNVYQLKEGHWANLRNWAMRNLPLKHEWLLFLDADEKLTEALKREISALLKDSPEENGFYIKRRFIFMGRWLKHGSLYPKVLRLFRHRFTEYIANGDVEYAKVKGKVGSLKHDMIHEDQKSISRWIKKHDKISERAAKQHLSKRSSLLGNQERGSEIEGGRRIWIKETIWEKIPLAFRPSLTFLYQYVFRLGFLDGLEGLIYHFLQAFWYRLLIYVKVRQLKNNTSREHKHGHARQASLKLSYKETDELDSYVYAQENLIQWGIPYGFLFKSRFVLFFFLLLSSHYSMTYKQLIRSPRILDVGCGLGSPIRVLRCLGLPSRVIGVDVHIQYLQRVRKFKIYDDRVLATAKYLPFKEKAFNSVICLQVLEHLPKRGGIAALRELSRVADMVVVTTPVSFVKADIDPRNPFQKHKSGWYPKDLEYLGYKVKGYGWFRITKHSCLAPLLVLMNVILIPILHHFPRFAYHMCAVKTS